MFAAQLRDPNIMNCRRVALSLVVIGLGLSGCTAQSAHTSPSITIGRPCGHIVDIIVGVPPTSTPSPSTARASFDLGYPPLLPQFSTLGEAQSWQLAHRVGGQQPWHIDAGATALAFASGWLGFRELDTVTSTTYDRTGAHISIGYKLPTTGHLATAAVLHLVRFSPLDSPWEVVGSEDDLASFSLEQPSYGSTVSSPMTVAGHISGVTENIKITVRQLASESPVGQTCCLPAGPVNPPDPWSTSVTFTGSGVLTIIASTGGHLHQVERFAIQGVHT